jgi:hypothetical protein
MPVFVGRRAAGEHHQLGFAFAVQPTLCRTRRLWTRFDCSLYSAGGKLPADAFHRRHADVQSVGDLLIRLANIALEQNSRSNRSSRRTLARTTDPLQF